MDLKLHTQALSSAAVPALIVPVFDDVFASPTKTLTELNRALGGALLEVAQAEGFKGKSDQLFCTHTHGKLKAARVALVGLGARKKYRTETLRLAAGRAAKWANR